MRKSVSDWETIRAEYEAGASQATLSTKFGVSRTAIQKHIRAESWAQDVTGTINRIAEEKVAGIVAGCNHKKKAEAIDAAADRKAEVILRHQREWEEHAQLYATAREEGATDPEGGFTRAKLAKILAETLKLRQDGERKAWGIVDSMGQAQVAAAQVTVDFSGMRVEDVMAVARAAWSSQPEKRQEAQP